ncbi:hypothetical protein GCM10027447_05050 [Glycomyces halotolerans]
MATVGEVVAAIRGAISRADEAAANARTADSALSDNADALRRTLDESNNELPHEAFAAWKQAQERVAEALAHLASATDAWNRYVGVLAGSGTSVPTGGNGSRPLSGAAPYAPRSLDLSRAGIDDRKLTHYVLDPMHPVGGHKARVIKSRTGLGPGDAEEVKRQIREKAPNGEPMPGRTDVHGTRWSIDLDLTGPKGTMTVRTAWIVDRSGARLVTMSFPPKEGP